MVTWRAKNQDKRRDYDRRLEEKQPGRRMRAWRKHLLKRYGLTPEAYEARLVEQGGRCAICRRLPEEGALSVGKHGAHLSVDHNHETGHFRGLLCGACNAGLGYFRDNNEMLKRAVAYLELTNAIPNLRFDEKVFYGKLQLSTDEVRPLSAVDALSEIETGE